MRHFLLSFGLISSFLITGKAETARFSCIQGGKNIGHLIVQTDGAETKVDFNVKDNGRGPTIAETIELDPDGLPAEWVITGTTIFGSKVDEHFTRHEKYAEWLDSVGKGRAPAEMPSLYIPQSGSPWADQIYLSALLKSPGMTMPTLPGGKLTLSRGETLTVNGQPGPLQVTKGIIQGIKLVPDTILLDAENRLFAVLDPSRLIVRVGYEGEEQRLRSLASDWATQRYVAMQHRTAHDYGSPVRIRNVRLFDPKICALTSPRSVLVNGKEIAAIESLDLPTIPGEVLIDGEGGTLVAGMYEMHAHLQQDEALLNLMAGTTTVRDMGNDNTVLDQLIKRIEAGEIGGPHVIRSGFIEGRSPFSANNGILVGSQDEAIDAVRWYGARGYWQIKIYNSMNPAWVPAIVKEAHSLGMRVAGHVPAFANADQMIEAGYDEMTHINQVALGWILGPGEDTRTLLRLTALKRLPGLDLDTPRVQHTINLMAERNKAIDPTLSIHENVTLNRDGQIPPGAVDYIDHLPIGARRELEKAYADVSAPGADQAYRDAFEKLVSVVRKLHDRGVFIVFGTDTGGSFTFHRELELYQKAGMTAPEILRRATYDSAKYTGQDQRLGSIEKGKLADFFLVAGDPTKDLKAIKSIRMVVKDGTFFYPAEIYPEFGIVPFSTVPKVQAPSNEAPAKAGV